MMWLPLNIQYVISAPQVLLIDKVKTEEAVRRLKI